METNEKTGPPAVTEPRVPVRLGITPTTIDEAWRLAQLIAKSGLAPKGYVDKPNDVLAAMQMGAELGLSPMTSLRHIAVINGRPSIWGDAALGIVLATKQLAFFEEQVGEDRATCTVQRKGWPNKVERTFSLADAKRAGLLDKESPWRTYPRRMLQMRARSWALRDTFPDALGGLMTSEEAGDLPPEGGSVYDITPEPQKPLEPPSKSKAAKTASEPTAVPTAAGASVSPPPPPQNAPESLQCAKTGNPDDVTDPMRAIDEIEPIDNQTPAGFRLEPDAPEKPKLEEDLPIEPKQFQRLVDLAKGVNTKAGKRSAAVDIIERITGKRQPAQLTRGQARAVEEAFLEASKGAA